MKDKKRQICKLMLDIVKHYDAMIESSYVEDDNKGSRHYKRLQREALAMLKQVQEYAGT